jgi:hypothetical protein
MALVNDGRNDVAEQSAEFNEQRLWCEGKNAEMPDLLTLNAASYLDLELPSQILPLNRPVSGLIIAKGASHHLEVQGLVAGGMTLRRHRREDRLRRHQRLVIADGGAEPDDVRCAVFVDAGDDRNPCFMFGFHGQKDRFGMIGDGIKINELVVPRAHQHEVLEASGKLRRPDRIAARAAFDVSDDVRDEAEYPVLAAGDEVANQIGVTSAVLAASRRAGPQC